MGSHRYGGKKNPDMRGGPPWTSSPGKLGNLIPTSGGLLAFARRVELRWLGEVFRFGGILFLIAGVLRKMAGSRQRSYLVPAWPG
jgi:hypothetical protein